MPTLCVCRGMQVLNVVRGGTLIQHLPEVLQHDDHRRNLGTFEGNEHDVQLVAGSLAAQAAGSEQTMTKSHHHQAIDELGYVVNQAARSLATGRRQCVALVAQDMTNPFISAIAAGVADALGGQTQLLLAGRLDVNIASNSFIVRIRLPRKWTYVPCTGRKCLSYSKIGGMRSRNSTTCCSADSTSRRNFTRLRRAARFDGV